MDQSEQDYGMAFALSCQIPQFLQLPSDIQRGLMDVGIRLGQGDFACLYYLKFQIDAWNLDAVKALLIHLNKPR